MIMELRAVSPTAKATASNFTGDAYVRHRQPVLTAVRTPDAIIDPKGNRS